MFAFNKIKFISKRYPIPGSSQVLEFSPPVLRIFNKYNQSNGHLEAGGLLFAKINLPNVIVKEATVPHELDNRSRYGFSPCKLIQHEIIQNRFSLGLHFIGEWHTHPEEFPTPSSLDIFSMSDSFVKSKHELNYFVLVIVGSVKDDISLWVSLHNDSKFIKL